MKSRSIFKRIVTFMTAAAIALCMFAYSSSSILTVEASTQSELENRLKEIEKEKEALKKKQNSTANDISKEEEHQEAIEDEIKATEEYIRTLNDLIDEYSAQIAALEDEISVLEGDIEIQQKKVANKRAEIDDNIGLYERRIRAMYLSGNDSVASIILGATDFFDMLMKVELVKRVAKNDNDLIQSLLDMKTDYEAAQLELENQVAALEETVEITEGKKKEQEDLKADWEAKLEELQALAKQSKKIIKELEAKEAAYKADQKALDKEADKIEEEIQKIIREKARAEYMGDLPKGDYLWPLPGYYMITSPYGSRWGTTHRGIDISGSDVKGANITAANSGIVITVNNSCTHNYGKSKSCKCGSGFGNYCIIDHGGGYQSLYAHAERIIVKEGQKVSTGDVLGYVGSTGDSTGWHLHFETRVNGERVDPQGSKVNLIIK